MQTVNQWGPALLVCLTVVIGIINNNSRLNDLNKRIDDLRSEMNTRFVALEKLFDEKLKRVEEVLDARLKHLEEVLKVR
jgi:hypothetical protein